ncbi:cathepsin L-like proteinase [Diorhabda sublineata]|uniref:cathepsin L-like proteinase n=1 Tax=Diorhabda sublineata TaxID=1163346 RepID=UPI0024E05DD8|nr:cathepsin L-like proteinase [Diorhabda sublineata]
MRLYILLVNLIVITSASNDYEQWEQFKIKFSRNFSLTEEEFRFEIFQNNLRKIEEHNVKYEKGEVSYFLKVTDFADWTSEEYRSMLQTQQSMEPKVNPIGTFKSEYDFIRPDSIDWREKGAVLDVKQQGNCGSGWAFSTTGALEAQLAIHRNLRIPLSEQELVSCVAVNYGCSGGWLGATLQYVHSHGLSSSEQYPYTATDGTCREDLTNKTIDTIQGYVILDKDEEAIADAVGSVGPVSVYANANYWSLYGGGIFDNSDCNNDYNHGVLITGYDQESWTIKNSLGPDWGENGYIRLVRGKDQCGITVYPIYPVL